MVADNDNNSSATTSENFKYLNNFNIRVKQ